MEHFVFLTFEHDYFHYDDDLMWMMITLVAFTFPQTPETTKIAGCIIFSDSLKSVIGCG